MGADGLVSSYFSKEGGLIPFDNDGTAYENPGRCARYRAYLSTTDITESPVVYEVSLNYSL